MVLNYHPTNYTGWPVPALFHYFLCISLHATKLQKISESCNFFCNYFQGLPTLFPWLPKKCQEASQQEMFSIVNSHAMLCGGQMGQVIHGYYKNKSLNPRMMNQVI